jgi:ABC-type antimicrobial peptide transport system permease subunit
MSLTRFSLREAQLRPGRIFLTFLSIAIGVGAVVSVLLSTTTSRTAQREMLKAVSGKSDLELASDTPNGFSYDIVGVIRQTPGVELAAPVLNRIAVLFVGEERARAQVFGIDPRVDQLVRDYEVVAGRFPEKYDEILLDRSFADSLGVELGAAVENLGSGWIGRVSGGWIGQPTRNGYRAGERRLFGSPLRTTFISKSGPTLTKCRLLSKQTAIRSKSLRRYVANCPRG